MADVTLSYKGSDILELSNSGSATLKTGGKYCEDDIAVEYVKPSGGGTLYGVTRIDINTLAELGGEALIVSAPSLSTLSYSYANLKLIRITDIQKEVLLLFGNQPNTSALSKLETLDLNGAKCAITAQYAMRYHTNLKTINARVRVTNGNQTFSFCPITSIRFQENKSTAGFSMTYASLDNDSLVSLANGLSDTVTSTVTLTSANKTTAQSITGTISQVTDADSNTYDFFTADANGTVTLMDFITNTKGWTVA